MSSKGWTWAGINSCAVKLSSKILLQEFGEVWEGTGIYCWYIVQYFFSLWKCSKSCLWEQINLFLVDKFTIDRWISSRNNGASSSPPHMFLSEKIWDPKENAGVLQYYTIYQYDILCVFLCWVHWDLRFKIPIYIWTCFFFLKDFAWGSWAGMAGHTVPLPLEFIDVQLLNDSVAIWDTDSPFQNSARMENVVVANHRRDLQLSHRLIDDIHVWPSSDRLDTTYCSLK